MKVSFFGRTNVVWLSRFFGLNFPLELSRGVLYLMAMIISFFVSWRVFPLHLRARVASITVDSSVHHRSCLEDDLSQLSSHLDVSLIAVWGLNIILGAFSLVLAFLVCSLFSSPKMRLVFHNYLWQIIKTWDDHVIFWEVQGWPRHLPVLQSYDLLEDAQGYGHMGKIPGQIPSTWEDHMSALKTTQTSLCRACTPEDKAS